GGRRGGRPGLGAGGTGGDLSGGVGLLLDVDGEGEEVDALTGGLLAVGGDQYGGVAHLDDDGALRLRGQLARLEREDFVLGSGDRAGNGDGVSHARSLSVVSGAGDQLSVVSHPIGAVIPVARNRGRG